jgi:TRAP-type C4-dicarboxylate transport system permease large subunit
VTWIARTAMPLFFLMIAAVIATYFFPDVVLWLPRQMQG